MKPISSRNTIFGWCMYDFANSPFTTLIISFIYSVYFTKTVGEDGTILWSRAITLSAILVALLSPIMGAIADRTAWRKRLMGICALIMIVSVCLLNITPLPSYTIMALVLFVLANVSYELGIVFYNAFLPDITTPQTIGRVSGYGWGCGYVGGLFALVAALFVFPLFGITTQSPDFIHAVLWLTACWMAVFCLPTFILVKETTTNPTASKQLLTGSFQQLYHTLHEIRRYKPIVRLLLARLFYNDGLITIFAFAGIYAGNEFGFTTQAMLLFGIVVNIAAGLGAVGFGYIDDQIGGKKTIMITIFGLSTATFLAAIAWHPSMIWIAGILAGIFSGPNQAASRSLLGRFVPKEKKAEFYGFFAFSGKMTAFLGPFCYGLMTQIFDTERAGVAFTLVFFIIGGFFLYGISEKHDKYR